METEETPAEAPAEASTEGTITGTASEAPTFDESVVKALRAEAAEHRVRARTAISEANSRLLAQTIRADGRLVDAEVLQLSDELIGEDGWLDPAKVTDGITAIITEKPYLSASRPSTVIPQGARQAVEAPPSFGELIKMRM